jgi:FAD/FMN-containing dehydrogenase
MIDRRPALIAQCAGTPDVVDALTFGVAVGLEIAVRGGGHLRAQAGVCWGEFNRATQLHGLATTGGVVASTGIAGLTLGGGFGYLMGKYGYTVDNLLSVEVVTADGSVLAASDEENSDLFWGLRGGGGNFGIATSFEFTLHPVGPTVQGGLIAYPFEYASDVLGFARNLARVPEDEMTVAYSLSHAPDGKKLAGLLLCHCGDAESSWAALASARAVAVPLIDRLGPIDYSELNRLLDPGFPKLALNYWKSCFLASLSDSAIEVLISQFAKCPSDMSKLIVEHPHGAALRRSSSDMAFPHREEGFSILILAQWRDAAASEENISWARETHERLACFAVPGAYSNYLGDDETHARVKEAFGANFERLQSLKNRYDPTNVFRRNQNIPPSS